MKQYGSFTILCTHANVVRRGATLQLLLLSISIKKKKRAASCVYDFDVSLEDTLWVRRRRHCLHPLLLFLPSIFYSKRPNWADGKGGIAAAVEVPFNRGQESSI